VRDRTRPAPPQRRPRVREGLRGRRERLGLTQAQVAGFTGISANHVSNVENGGHAASRTVLAISATLAAFEAARFDWSDVDRLVRCVDAVDGQLDELERRLEQLEADRAEVEARVATAGLALVNGHAHEYALVPIPAA
jgi:transcriptional regulator with XRE-family HTH domain